MRFRVLVVTAMVAAVAATVPGGSASAGQQTTEVFGFTGGSQTFTVPAGVTSVDIVACGALGGNGIVGVLGGLGGEATKTISVMPGEVLTVSVGGRGAHGNSTQSPFARTPGGFNGGGSGGFQDGGGGGATDVRQGGSDLADRVVVGGGGGGSGRQHAAAIGGAGGGSTGGDGGDTSLGAVAGTGGTQTTGGLGGTGGNFDNPGGDGSLGVGGDGGEFAPSGGGGGGGGGGLYGGGGGAQKFTNHAAGGGGGSGLGDSFAPGTCNGDAFVTITYTPPPPTLDFGDAPDSYSTSLGSGGASHAVGSLFMGALVDPEPDGQPSVLADGDDLDTLFASLGDDEDGVTLPPVLITGTPASVTVDGGPSGGLLDGWIDFDGSGVFDDPVERITVLTGSPLAAVPGNVVSFTVPAGATLGPTYARFRLSSVGGLIPTGGPAPDGEVEDYRVEIAAPPVVISPGAAAVVEGDDPSSVVVEVPVTLSEPAPAAGVTVNWTTIGAGLTPGLATEDVDFDSVDDSVLTFNEGEMSKTVSVTVNGDDLDEPELAFGGEWGLIAFSSPSANAVIDTSRFFGFGIFVIVDDDDPPVIEPGSGSVLEGNPPPGGDIEINGLPPAVAVPVSLSAPSGFTVTVEWETIFNTGWDPTLAADPTPGPGQDYVAASGTVEFAPGETDKTVLIDVVPDLAIELNELIVVSFHTPTNATIGGFFGAGFGGITNDDTAPP